MTTKTARLKVTIGDDTTAIKPETIADVLAAEDMSISITDRSMRSSAAYKAHITRTLKALAANKVERATLLRRVDVLQKKVDARE